MIFEISKGLASFGSCLDLLRRTPLFYITIPTEVEACPAEARESLAV
jgi:hypothetical protein